MNFIKFQGFGNDYIVIEAEQVVEDDSLNELVRRVCDKHYGAGADGVALIGEAGGEGADFSVRIFNPDGGEAGLSGNGTRCAAASLYYQGLWTKEALRLRTRAGVVLYRLREDDGRGHYQFESELGQPKFDSASVPMLTAEARERITNYPLTVEGETLSVTALLMGNPNCCVFVDDFDALDWRKVGRAIETHELFPERTNVEFVRVRDRQNIELRIWERGVGETFSSGTCACAAAVASVINNKTGRAINVWTEGGRLEIVWRETDNQVVLTGKADVVYKGEWLDTSDG
ncbi:MAG: diaminopimelate epimerase [Pyrinomonadaceae bacterium]